MKYWMAAELPEDPDAWVSMAEEYQGSWRVHWISWLKERSGPQIDAIMEMGSGIYPVLDDAPGLYVKE